jgi:hypothetical protein
MKRLFPLFAVAITMLFTTAGLRAQSEPKEPVSPLKGPHRILLQLDHAEPAQMSSADSQLVASRQAQLSSAAATSGFDLQDAGWNYQQAVCPAFSTAVLLRYERNAGTDSASRFVAVVPRQDGDIRIVPVQRRGNTPFTESDENDNTIAIFNQLVSASGIDIHNPAMNENDNWVKLALCYAELAGHHPTTLLTDTLYGEAFERNVTMPKRIIDLNGAFLLVFSDVNDPKSTVNWSLKFDKAAQLTSVEMKAQKMNTPVRTQQTLTDLWPETATKKGLTLPIGFAGWNRRVR